MSADGIRLAMWSGPRNISTAMMRAWQNRADCVADDEPLYGAWLAASGARHPMREAVIASMDCDWDSATARLAGPIPGGKPLWYQKHMCHHLLPGRDQGWMDALVHVFLIREPEAVIPSYRDRHDELSPEALGYPQQHQLFLQRWEIEGHPPPVIDSRRFLADPQRQLRALCARLGLDFDPAMLGWAPGLRETDGIWAEHWYAAVRASTGFGPPPPAPSAPTDPELVTLAQACRPHYEALRVHALE